MIGAGHRATRGATTDRILSFYFPGLIDWRSPRSPRHPRARRTRPARRPPAAADIALALPGSEEAERAALLSLIRRSRDEIAKATGAIAPARLRVTVHPDRREFRPRHRPAVVGVGRDRRGRDRSAADHHRCGSKASSSARCGMRSRMPLLDGALAKRPMWVREGAAAYFASPENAREAGPRACRVRATSSCCDPSPPARSAMPTRAPKRASRARSPTANGGIRSVDRKRESATVLRFCVSITGILPLKRMASGRRPKG